MIAGIPWTLGKLKDTYGEKLGQKIHDSKNIEVECYNSKCKKFYKKQEIPDGGEGLISCPGCGKYFKLPGGKEFAPSFNPEFDKTIYEIIFEHYKASMKSKDRMAKYALSAIIMRIRGYEKEVSKKSGAGSFTIVETGSD